MSARHGFGQGGDGLAVFADGDRTGVQAGVDGEDFHKVYWFSGGASVTMPGLGGGLQMMALR